MEVKNIEISREEFDELNGDELFTVSLRLKYKRDVIDKMKNYILKRYEIVTDNSYPKVILIERDNEVRLIGDEKLFNESVEMGVNHIGKFKREFK